MPKILDTTLDEITWCDQSYATMLSLVVCKREAPQSKGDTIGCLLKALKSAKGTEEQAEDKCTDTRCPLDGSHMSSCSANVEARVHAMGTIVSQGQDGGASTAWTGQLKKGSAVIEDISLSVTPSWQSIESRQLDKKGWDRDQQGGRIFFALSSLLVELVQGNSTIFAHATLRYPVYDD
ncbi:hypothetical protein TIFTF001_016592 [Ficus carica]|uniref:Uncharacterized protein n=1 Tax=Ficus carica TaxID=3494 RepID=A0AA88A947_FICCA|nr:hypothetical protein TIFTF001_016592 [Ficus carica]